MARLSKVLFLTDEREDYLADGLLHGLRQISAINTVDFPRKESLYALDNLAKTNLRGGGFTLYGLLDENLRIDRNFIQQKLEDKWFDLIVISNIWRQWGLMTQWENLLKNQRALAILDGDDDDRFYPSSGTRIRHFGPTRWLRNLISHPNTIYFKREWTRRTYRWPYNCKLKPIAFSIPNEKIIESPTTKKLFFPSHIVDREVAKFVNAQTNYAFTTEIEYRQNLAESRFGITTKRGGWECLRHYEIAASGTIPCFKNLASKPTSCAPHGLVDGVNCISYNTTQDLMEQINKISQPAELAMRRAALEWAKKSSTKLRAIELLQAMKIDP